MSVEIPVRFPDGVRVPAKIKLSDGTSIPNPDGLTYHNTEACWDYLSTAGKYARYLDFVDADAFEDHRNPAPHLYMQPAGERESIGAEIGWFDYWQLPVIRSDLRALLQLPISEGGR